MGVVIALITAAAVFAGGNAFIARQCQPGEGDRRAGAAEAAEAPPAPSSPSPAVTAPVEPSAPAPQAPPTPTAADERRAVERDKNADKGSQKESDKGSDKDLAREAWRKNLPEISADATRATILIPIKGSIEGATYHVGTKPRAVIVNLPQAESLITMRFYSIKHDGFRTLWVKKDDTDGTTLRLMLGDVFGPQVEIKDEYVRITVRKLADVE